MQEGISEKFPCRLEGVIYRRSEENHNICSEELMGHYEYKFKGELGQLPIIQLIEDLQLTLKAYKEAGIK